MNNVFLTTRYYYNVTLVAKTACTTDVHFWSINPGVGPLLVCQYWTGGPLLVGQKWTGGPFLVRQYWTGSNLSVNTGPSSCYIELYTVYLSGTIPASYCRAFNRRGLPGRLSLACSSRQLRSLLVCGREVYHTTEEHIATARRENWCNQVFEQDMLLSA